MPLRPAISGRAASARLAGAFGLAGGLLAGALFAGAARADEPPPIPIGPPAYDEARPTGREVAPPRGRPDAAEAPVTACSFREPVCVHAQEKTPPASTLWTLRWAERALRAYRALGLPPPLPDGALGGSPAFDIYLLPSAGEARTVPDLVPQGGGHDRQSAFTILPPPPPPPAAGCAASFTIAQGIAHAVALRFDAGVEDGAASMLASYLASLATDCSVMELAAVDAIQRFPERSLFAGSPDVPDGSLLFPWYLDDTYGQGPPGKIIASLVAISAQQTKPGSWEWNNEPDLLDTLRANMKSRSSSLDALLLDFAVSRAFVGDRSDGAHLSGVERFGAMGRVRFEWALPFGSLPRRVAPMRPLEPTGSTYLWVDLAGAPAGAELTFAADWELPSIFRWALVKIDKDGGEAGRVEVAGVYGDGHVERTVVGLDGMAGVLVVGVNGGSFDRGHPFDPDEGPGMPHSYTVTFAK
jgi:hypothetical protein